MKTFFIALLSILVTNGWWLFAIDKTPSVWVLTLLPTVALVILLAFEVANNW